MKFDTICDRNFRSGDFPPKSGNKPFALCAKCRGCCCRTLVCMDHVCAYGISTNMIHANKRNSTAAPSRIWSSMIPYCLTFSPPPRISCFAHVLLYCFWKKLFTLQMLWFDKHLSSTTRLIHVRPPLNKDKRNQPKPICLSMVCSLRTGVRKHDSLHRSRQTYLSISRHLVETIGKKMRLPDLSKSNTNNVRENV